MGDPSSSGPDSSGPDAAQADTRGGREGPRARSGLLGGRFLAALAAVAIGLVAAVVIVSVGDDGTDDASGPDEAVDITALPDDASDGEDTDGEATGGTGDDEATGPTDGTDDEQLGATVVGPVDVEVARSTEGLFEMTLTDPATPSAAGAETRHCVMVTLVGPALVETHSCTPVGDEEAATPVEARLGDPGGAVIGCAAVATAAGTGAVSALDATSRFVVTEGAELPPGDYQVDVVAVSGSADGCAPSDEPDEHHSTVSFALTVG